MSARKGRRSATTTLVMLVAERAFRDGATKLLDIGGSVAVYFYAYRRDSQTPQGLSWRVVEAPAITAIGRKIASQAEATGLSFAEDLSQALHRQRHLAVCRRLHAHASR
ncbi:hypothetical protein [Variovorax durovernensis]